MRWRVSIRDAFGTELAGGNLALTQDNPDNAELVDRYLSAQPNHVHLTNPVDGNPALPWEISFTVPDLENDDE